MTLSQSICTILIVMTGTMLTRFLPFLLFPSKKKPAPIIQYLGRVLPYAVMGMLIVYCLKDAPSSSHHGVAELLAIVVIVLLHQWKKNTLLSIAGGTICYMFLVQQIF